MTGYCPYGPFLLVPMLTSTAALAMTCFFAFDCRFFQTSGGYSFGLWTVRDWGMCMGWNSNTYFADFSHYLDAPLRFARVASMLLSIISLMLIYFLVTFVRKIYSPGTIKKLACGFGLVGVGCFLCLIALASDLCRNAFYCTMGRDGILCLCAAILWIVAAVSMLYLRPEEVKIQETVASDGTVTALTTRSRYNADETVMTATETREVRASASAPAYATLTLEL